MKRALLLLVVLAACSEHKKPEGRREPDRQRRVVEPPARGVRALPPHAIRPDGVGPYKLGATVAALLDQLPSGPRITQFTLPGVIQRDILRAEDDAIVIGAEPQGKATFVGVVVPEIARTETGVHVGSTRAELEKALGRPIQDPERARDPHVVIPASFKNARILLDDSERIIAFLVAAQPERDKPASAESACTRPAGDREAHTFGICLSMAGELVRAGGDELVVLARDGEKPIAAPMRVPGLVFAAPLRNPSDGRDDLVAVTRSADAGKKVWTVGAYRLYDGKLVRVVEPTDVYTLTAANARWIGADLGDLDLYLELASRSDSLEVGGLLTTRDGDKIRDIVVITPVSVPRRRPKPAAHEPIDAGTTEDASPRATTSVPDARSR